MIKVSLPKNEEYINIVSIDGHIAGVFKSYVHWSKLGSRSSIARLVFKRYHSETGIDIVSQNISNIPTIEEE